MKIKSRLKNLSKKQKISILVIFILILLISATVLGMQIVRQIEIRNIQGKQFIEYKTTSVTENEDFFNIVVSVNCAEGLDQITYKNTITNKDVTINCNNRVSVAFDLVIEDLKDYTFIIKKSGELNGSEYTLHYEAPRIYGEYVLKNGVYVNKPDLTGYNENTTRYIDVTSEGHLIPGNWISGEEPENWFDYNNQKWANIYTENSGVDGFFVWIPRYVYKLDQTTQRSDVKFVDVYNNYTQADGTVVTWKTLKQDGYKLPEAFEFYYDNGVPVKIPGYWMSKYQLSNLTSYIIDYNAVATKTSIGISNISTNTTKTIATYTYALNGEIKHTSPTPDNYQMTGLERGTKIVNVTALDENGEIVGSMTRSFEPVQVNSPDLTGFDPDTTFYVWWDEDGNEHNETPISKDPPEDWYDYSIAYWANIVTRNNGIESYFVWIPRYQYALDQTSQRSHIKFIEGTSTEVENGYKIPEAFWWDNNGNGLQDEGEQLSGYWMSKYQLSVEESNAKMDAQMAPGINFIRIKDITGTVITTGLKYEYYLNGNLQKDNGTDPNEHYIFQNLEPNTMYTINIIARNSDTNAFVGAVTKKIKTAEPYAPDLTGFNKDNTFYVLYDENENETRISINEPVPDGWYDYSNQKWANIVTTANGTTSYFVWIPRYEYQILADRGNLNKANRRIDVNFITTDITNANCTPNYKVPEAFWWDNNGNGVQDEGEQLKGYWMSKYQLSN